MISQPPTPAVLAALAKSETHAAMRRWLDHETAHGCVTGKGADGCVLSDRLWRNFKALTELQAELERAGEEAKTERGAA